MTFIKYQHIERFGTSEVEGIEDGEVYVFPKLDGTNASVWFDGEKICAGSRNRELSLEADNAGFYAWVLENESLARFFSSHPDVRLYGEWLVPHSLKSYRDDAWRDFYVFDVTKEGMISHVPFDIYQEMLSDFSIRYISPIAKIINPTKDDLLKLLEKNTYLIKDGEGFGEGIVIKNYEFVNKYQRQTWAKIVSNEFKEKHTKTMGAPKHQGSDVVEDKIVEAFVTPALCEKVFAKIKLDSDGFSSKQIPQLLNTVYYDMVREDMWEIVKKFKSPKIDFKRLQGLTFRKVKSTLLGVF